MRKGRRRAPYWNRERVIEGLQHFARQFGVTPCSTEEYQAYTAGTMIKRNAPGNPFPSFASVLKHFKSFREAWTACGVEVNRGWEPWSKDEDWFIGEACGLLTRNEIAAYLNRTPDAVHRRLYDLGIDSRKARGWTAHRAMQATGVGDFILRQYMERGELPFQQGTKCSYFDPADLLIVREVDWSQISLELEAAIRRSLMARLVAVLSGRDWRANRPYRAQVARTTTKRWNEANRQQTMTPPPYTLLPGDAVKLRKPLVERPGFDQRTARVFSVYFSRTSQAQNSLRRGLGPCWVARIECKREGELPRLHATIPLVHLEKVEAV